MRPFFKIFESLLDRLLGLFGGLVCAFAASVMAFYACGVFHYHIWYWVAACLASVLVFGILGLVLPRYFACFFIPMFNGLVNAGGNSHSDDGYSWPVWIACSGQLIAFAALFVGALFQIHVVFGLGVILFFGFAMFAPKVFMDQGRVG